MSRDTIPPSQEPASTSSYGVSASVQSIQSMAAAAVQTRASLPTLALQPPDTGHSSLLTRYEAAATPGGEDEKQTPLPTTPDSPQAIVSAATTPVVPSSHINVRRNRRPSATAGAKRTASGTVKPITISSASVPNSPAPPATPARFVRAQSSIDTSPRNVSQLSSQLRTRLTYAMLKVQNNWTSESLDQVEARVSQGQQLTSPSSRTRLRRESSAGDERGFDYIGRHHRTSSEPFVGHPLSQNHEEGGSGRTYESFWREHESNPITKKILQAKAASQALGSSTSKHVPPPSPTHSTHGALQPPAQIIPDRDRKSHYNPPRQRPGLYHSLSNQSNASTRSMAPNTPPSSNTTSDSQRSMEQDAVESLMFLSSPGHSRAQVARENSLQSQLRGSTVPGSEPSSQESYSYGRGATTWPRGRRGLKAARTALGALYTMDSGVGFEEELTDEDVDTGAHSPMGNGTSKQDPSPASVIADGTSTREGVASENAVDVLNNGYR